MASSDNSTQIHVVKTSDLDAEFNIGKNTRVSRLAAIGLTPDKLHKDGKSYWLTQAQYSLFQDLDKYIIETGNMKGFPFLCATPNVDANEAGQLATVDTDIIRPPSHAGLDSTAYTGEFENNYPTGYTPDRRLARIDANAQQTAAGVLIAEAILADKYLQNPDRLPTHLRQQIDAVEYRQIDPKELAASLIRGVENQINFGKAA
jgi:hypothetical protein